MVKKGVKREIDKAIKHIWLNEACSEYGQGHFILERSIQCSFYHHLRNKLDPLLKENNLIIYPEYYFPDLKFYADLAICEMDINAEGYLQDRVTDIAAIIEIKYGGSSDYIKTDLPKFKSYMQSLEYDCQYYFAVIDLRSTINRLQWLDGRSTGKWASGRFTELDAGWFGDAMLFEVHSYNGMNAQKKSTKCEMLY